jgi:ABC-2 type transport system ATP-binding protein
VEIREFVKKLNREREATIIVTTHTMVDADMLCDRIGIIDHGKVAALDTSTNLKRLISGDNGTVLKLDIPNLTPGLVESIRAVGSVSSVSQDNSTHLNVIATGDDAFDNVVDAVRRNGGKIASMDSVQPTLEDVFLHLTGHEVRDSADQKIPLQRRRRFMGGSGGRNRIR